MKKFINIILLFITVVVTIQVNAQGYKTINMPEHDNKPYYFGINFGYNQSAFRMSHVQNFGYTDTFRNIQAQWGSGFHLGLMGTLHLNRFVDARLLATILFANKPIMAESATLVETKNTESIYMHVPLQLKWKSDRIENFRFYALTGMKLDYDMAANSRSRRSDEYLKVKPLDLGLEIGVGFDFFFPNFILTPEIKISQGLLDSHHRDTDLKMSNTIDQLKTRMFVFSLMIQS